MSNNFDSPIKIGKMSYKELHHEYRRLEETIRYLLPKLTESEILLVANLATNLCSHCWAESANCKCGPEWDW